MLVDRQKYIFDLIFSTKLQPFHQIDYRENKSHTVMQIMNGVQVKGRVALITNTHLQLFYVHVENVVCCSFIFIG